MCRWNNYLLQLNGVAITLLCGKGETGFLWSLFKVIQKEMYNIYFIIRVSGLSLVDYNLDKETLTWVEWCLSMII